MLPDTEPKEQSKPVSDPDRATGLTSTATDQALDEDSNAAVQGQGSDSESEADQADAVNDGDVPSAQDTDSSEDVDDSDMDSDSDMSVSEDTEDETTESREVIPVTLPEDLADLTAGREDANDDDDVVQAILRAREVHREHPPTIEVEDNVASMSFHPEQPIIALGTFLGDVVIYKYSNEACEIINTHELHLKAIRNVDFNKSGNLMITTSKDLSINVSDVETGKLRNSWDKAHSAPPSTLYILNENQFCTGCEEGFVKLWDTRQKDPVFSLQVMEDVVNAIVSTPENKYLAVACGGVLSSINVNSRIIDVQSEDYTHDFTCLGVFRQGSKLVAGSSKGRFYVFNWGQFGYHIEEIPGFKHTINCLLPVAETCLISGWEDGRIRGTHLFPHQALGVVGQHKLPVESMDISHDGVLIASAATGGQHVKFWNIKYLEEMKIYCRRKNSKRFYNLPSSNVRNVSEFFTDLI